MLKFICISILIFLINSNLHALDNQCLSKNFDIKLIKPSTIIEILDQLSDKCNFSFICQDPYALKIITKSLNGVNINHLALHEIFDILLKENNINYTFDGKILKLHALSSKTFKLDYIISNRQGRADLSSSVSTNVNINRLKDDTKEQHSNHSILVKEEFNLWNNLAHEINATINNGTEEYKASMPIINKNAGLISVTALNSQLKRVEKYLDELKKRLHKQVLIDVNIISVALNNNYTSGVDWSKFALFINSHVDKNTGSIQGDNNPFILKTINDFERGTYSFNMINNLRFSMEGLLNFLNQNGKSKIISSPKIMSLNNQQALISVGDTINFQIAEYDRDFKDDKEKSRTTITYGNYSIFIGVLLNILPEISDDDLIMLRINPSISSFKYSQDDQKQSIPRQLAPDTMEKKLSTVVRLKDSQSIILGGLIGQTKSHENTSVPILSKIPLLGMAFKSKKEIINTTELIFIITPRIIKEHENQKDLKSLEDLGFLKEHL